MPADMDDCLTFDVLVTGSSGHLGTALMLSLPDLGFKPLGIDLLPSPTTHVVIDIASPDRISELFNEYHYIRHVLHAATLHKPHVETHTKQSFVDTNISGTLALLEAAASMKEEGSQTCRVKSFVFYSTTSAFGNALTTRPGLPAVWIDESVTPRPKNIYGVTKIAAEDLCLLVHQQTSMPVIILRTSRFFPEQDDDEERRAAMTDDNLKVLELAYRRCDIADVVSAGVCAMNKGLELGWGKYVISAPPPLKNDAATLEALDQDPVAALRGAVTGVEDVFDGKGWKVLKRIDRVYDSSKAVKELGWAPKFTFQYAVEALRLGHEWRSELTAKVGQKGYHAYKAGVYTV